MKKIINLLFYHANTMLTFFSLIICFLNFMFFYLFFEFHLLNDNFWLKGFKFKDSSKQIIF